jgi:carboxyl-terminal processing protease
MVEKLGDQYSIFQEPAVSQAFNDSLSNEIQGIGASLGLDSQNNVIVISPIKGSPAEKAGILPGDIISKVDNKPLNNLSLAEVVRQIQGPAGTSVAVELKRGTRVFSLTITRTKLSVPVVTGEVTNDKILIMTINNFGVGTVEAFAQIANDAKSKNKLNGIIIDLRNNPGGFLTAAIDIAGYFLDKGKVVTKLVGPKVSETEYSNGPATLKGIPTYVLINKGSASAAEILAGALSANGAATLVGNQTFGKGTVQEVTSYSDNSALKLTVAEWLLPSGKSINKVGLSPDIKVDYTDADLKIGIDPQKLRALKALRGL